MGRLIDLTGLHFGRLEVIRRVADHIQPNGKPVVMWECKCSCEKNSIVVAESKRLRGGEINSCGCIREEERQNRLFEVNKNRYGCLMKIVEYNSPEDIIVEFQDEYRAKVRTTYSAFIKGQVRNPYHRSVCDIAIIGNKYPIRENGKIIKEYNTWHDMIWRCFDQKFKEKYPTYKDVTCCDEWLLFENFYDWLHNQPNFDKWLNGNKWEIDKDILVKRNKVYSPETCCLVPHNVNSLFVKRDSARGILPIGVSLPKGRNKYLAHGADNGGLFLGFHETVNEAFLAYKNYTESKIKQTAQEEYDKGNITEQCYQAMMNYEVEITD